MILHICSTAQAQEFRCAGQITAPSLNEVGFVHCSDPGTVMLPANRLYAGRDDLVLLEIDPARVEVDVRWEPADPPIPDGPWFPHVYGPVPFAAVIAVHDFPTRPDGSFVLPVTLSQR